MFMILNIDVADKNPKYKSQEHQTEADAEPTPHSNDGTNTNDDAKQGEREQKTTRVTRVILQQVILQEIAQQQPKLRPLLIRVHMNLLELIRPKS